MNIQIAINYYNCPFIYLFWNRGGKQEKNFSTKKVVSQLFFDILLYWNHQKHHYHLLLTTLALTTLPL